ncbi:MAG: GAF domain-containing protein [Bacteroidales bacterium]|nr:GAF domain-containing protein [Bacteroidales bacterium]
MNWTKNLNLRVKLLLVILSIVGILILSGFIFTYQILQNTQIERSTELIRRQINETEQSERMFQDNARNLVTLIASDDALIESLDAEQSQSSAIMTLAMRLSKFKSAALIESNFNLDIAIFYTNGELLYATNKAYTENPQFSLLANGSGKNIITSYAMTYDGLMYVAAHAVFNSKNKQVGFIELSMPISQLLNTYTVQDDEEVAVLLANKEVLKFKQTALRSSKIGKYFLISSSGNSIDRSFLSQWINQTSKKEITIQQNEEDLYASKPLLNSENDLIAYLVIKKSMSQAISVINQRYLNLIYFMLVFIVLVIFLIRYLAIKMITKPMTTLKNLMNDMAKGMFPKIPKREVNDEITEIYNSLYQLNKALNSAASFADNIRQHNFEMPYQMLSESDTLGDALIKMRNQLKDSEEKKVQIEKEEKIKYWKTESFAHLGDEIRMHITSLDQLADAVTRSIMKSINAVYGVFYLVEENSLQTKVIIAGDRSKNQGKTIAIGEGLVGEVAKDKEFIHLKKIPENYINISSGLGDTEPKEVVIIPLINHGKINGVIEIAVLQPLFDFEIDFLKSASSNISAGVTEVLNNEETQELLEQSQQQAEELAAQEEEMRQNLEELQSTQEEAHRREQELRSQIETFQRAFPILEFNKEGKLFKFNAHVQDIFAPLTRKDLLKFGVINMFDLDKNFGINNLDSLFLKLQAENTLEYSTSTTITGQSMELFVKLVLVFDEDDEIKGVNAVLIDRLENIHKIDNLKAQLHSVNSKMEHYQAIVKEINQTKKNLM